MNITFDTWRSRVQSTLSRYPYQDGYGSPAEKDIEHVITSLGAQNVELLNLLASMCTESSIGADFLKCLSTFPNVGTTQWRTERVSLALASENHEVRDAAVQAAEHWSVREMVDVLLNHEDQEGWIQEAAQRVAHDIRENHEKVREDAPC